MKLLREYIRNLLLESADNGTRFTDEINSRFESRSGGMMAVAFPDGCEVQFEISNTFVMPFGPDDSPHARWNTIKTLGPDGGEDESCFRKGYARAAMEQVIDIADRYGVVLVGEAKAFGKKSTADTGTLIKFYSSLGFVPEGSQMKRYPK